MAESQIERREGVSIEPIMVDGEGNAYVDFTREKESIIKSERLDARNPVVKIDLETILTQDGGCAVSIVVQDFGLPARTINITGDFVNMRDVQGIARSEEHYSSAPKHLTITTTGPDHHKTLSLDEKDLPIDYEAVIISRGKAMIFVHDGKPSDERIGYIEDDFWGLVASDYYGSGNFSDIQSHKKRDYVPFIGLSYEDSILSIHSLDDVHAEVQYQQVRSLADEAPIVPEAIADEIDTEQLLANLIAGSDGAKATFQDIIEKRRETLATIDSLQSRLLEALEGNDNLETVLAGVKRKLHEARSEIARLDGEVRRLKQQAHSAPEPGEQTDSDFLHDLLGGRQSTEKDPHGHCAKLGLDPNFLLSLTPDAAIRVVKGVHRGLAVQFHSDRQGNETDDQPMKAINTAVDSILERLQNGYWGRH